MKIQELHIFLSQRMSKKEIITFAKSVTPDLFCKILSLIAYKEKVLSANASYILLHIATEAENNLSIETAFIMETIQATSHEKTQRLLLSLLERLKFDTINIKFLDYCLDKLISAKTPCAIRVLCMKLAFKQSTAYPELLSELKIILETMDTHMLNPSVTSSRKNILKKINSIL